MKDDDYGYFGKGIDGYVHYNESFERNFGKGGGGGGKKPGNNTGCGTGMYMTLLVVIVSILAKIFI